MVGHGAAYHPGNKSHIVVIFDKPKSPTWKAEFPGHDQENRLMTNIDLFTFPAYLRGRNPMPYVIELTGGSGVWMGHKIDDSANVRFTPARWTSSATTCSTRERALPSPSSATSNGCMRPDRA
jgi:hypothetical protein